MEVHRLSDTHRGDGRKTAKALKTSKMESEEKPEGKQSIAYGGTEPSGHPTSQREEAAHVF